MTRKAFTYRLFGWGVLPAPVKDRAIVCDEGCPGRFTLLNYFSPQTRLVRRAYKRYAIGIAVTDEQLVLYRGRSTFPVVLLRLPWKHPLWSEMKVWTEGEKLVLEWSIEKFQDHCSGQLQASCWTDRSEQILTEIRQRMDPMEDSGVQPGMPDNNMASLLTTIFR